MENRPIFLSGGEVYGWWQVLDLLRFLGKLKPIVGGVRTSIACTDLARQRGLIVGAGELEDALESLRYDLDLITAEETEVWLQRAGITLQDMKYYLERRHWKAALATDAAVADVEPAVSEVLVDDALWAEFVCDPQFKRFSVSLAARVAASLDKADEPLGRQAVADEKHRFSERVGCPPDQIADWLAGASMAQERLDDLARMEANYRATCADALTEANLLRQLQIRFLPLIRYDVQWAYFENDDIAREVHMCVAEDGEDLNEVLSRAGVESEIKSIFFNDLREDLKPLFMAVRPGKMSPPVRLDGSFGIFLVHDKTEPSIEDDKVRRLLEDGLMASTFANLIDSHVRWEAGFE